MSDFVKKAFQDALEMEGEQEFKAYREYIADRHEKILSAASIGLIINGVNIEKMLETICDSNLDDVFAKYMSALMMISFHCGYQAGREKAL